MKIVAVGTIAPGLMAALVGTPPRARRLLDSHSRVLRESEAMSQRRRRATQQAPGGRCRLVLI